MEKLTFVITKIKFEEKVYNKNLFVVRHLDDEKCEATMFFYLFS